MKPEYTFLALVLVHWVADFVLQSHTMATNKSTSIKWLSIHISVYSFTWFLVGIWFFPVATVAAFAGITFACHWVTDYFTSKWTSRLWKAGKVHDFFVVVGFDQCLHYTQLVLTYMILTS
jgi:hypothetical protein